MKNIILALGLIIPVIGFGQDISPKLATKQVIINEEALTNADKGMVIYVGNNSQIQVKRSAFDSYGLNNIATNTPTTGTIWNSLYLSLKDDSNNVTVFHENDILGESFGEQFSDYSKQIQSGNGEVDNPYQVITKFKAAKGVNINVDIEITDSYVVPNYYFDRKIMLSNLPDNYTAKVFWLLSYSMNPNCYSEGTDLLGGYDLADNTPDRMQLFKASDPEWSHYSVGDLYGIHYFIKDKNELDNKICAKSPSLLGVAAQWDIDFGKKNYTIETGQSFTRTKTVSAQYDPAVIDMRANQALTLTVSNRGPNDDLVDGEFSYTLPNNIELADNKPFVNTCNTSNVSVKGDVIRVLDIDLSAGSFDAPNTCLYTFAIKGKNATSDKVGSFADLKELDESIYGINTMATNNKVTVVNKSVAAAYSPAVINLNADETSVLTLTVSNDDTETSLSNAKFNYVLPDNIEIVNSNIITPIGTTCPDVTPQSNSIDVSGINLAQATSGAPNTCVYQVLVKAKSSGSNMAGRFTNLSTGLSAIVFAKDIAAFDDGDKMTVMAADISVTYSSDFIDMGSDKTLDLSLTVSNYAETDLANVGFNYHLPKNIEIANTTTKTNTCSESTPVTGLGYSISVFDINLDPGTATTPKTCEIIYSVKGRAAGHNMAGSFDNLIGFGATGLAIAATDENKVTVSAANISVEYDPAIINMSASETSKLTLTIFNYDIVAGLSNGAFDYNLPSNIKIGSAVTSNCNALASASGGSISASGIALDAATAAIPTTCTYQLQVKGKNSGNNIAGSFTNLFGLTDQSIVARITTTGAIPIPSSGLLGLFALVLVSIGLGRYYFKK